MKKLSFITLILMIMSIAHLTYGQAKDSFNGIYQTSDSGTEFKLYSDSTKLYKADKEPIVSFADFKKVKIKKSPYDGSPVLFIQLNKKGEVKLAKATQQNIKKPLLIIFKNRLLSAPVVMEAITGGQLQVTGVKKRICREIVRAYKK